jgi:hypothetical protein
MEIGPYVDGELGDEELDTTLPFGEPHEVPPMETTITFAPRTVGEAKPLLRALAKKRFDVTADVVRAMGVVALGAEKDATRIAEALASCDDDAFDVVSSIFLESHYPLRLHGTAICKACGAKNEVDAPYDRELEPIRTKPADMEPFPDFEAFAERAQAIAAPLVDEIPGERVDVIVDEATPAVDDGGEPLLGSYLPPSLGGGGQLASAPLVTIYYRTFRSMWEDDGPYDWDAELVETIEHELEHHFFFLRGEDPMDEEEREEIRAEAVRIVGRREAQRRVAQGFAASVSDFVKRTWLLWLLVIIALVVTLLTQR